MHTSAASADTSVMGVPKSSIIARGGTDQKPTDRDGAEMHRDPVQEEIRAEARRLNRDARRWSVEVPDEWYVTAEDDYEIIIDGRYHERVRARLADAKWRLLTSGIGLIGGVLGIAAFARSCSH
jgi:hypothetical protein